MKLVLSLLMFFQMQSAWALSGTWKFTEMIFKGEHQPLINPDLNLTWTFFENGTERLYWDHKGSPDFCERFANYTYENNQIVEVPFALNPQNAADCGKDPDMQLGRKITSKLVTVSNEQMHLHLSVGDDDLIYVLTKISNQNLNN